MDDHFFYDSDRHRIGGEGYSSVLHDPYWTDHASDDWHRSQNTFHEEMARHQQFLEDERHSRMIREMMGSCIGTGISVPFEDGGDFDDEPVPIAVEIARVISYFLLLGTGLYFYIAV